MDSMRDFERNVGVALREKMVVEYTVIPEYATAQSTVPDGFAMIAVGWAGGRITWLEGDYVLNARLDANGNVVNLGN